MKIVNQSKNQILALNASLALNPITRMIGLLGRKGLNDNEALVLKPCNSVHTLFMRFQIDVLFVDRNSKVVEAISELKPWRLTYIYWRSYLAIELPCGIIKSSKTNPGDIISMSSL